VSNNKIPQKEPVVNTYSMQQDENNSKTMAQKNTTQEGDVKMSIRESTDGNLFVDVENIVVSESSSAKEISKILSNMVKEKFSELVNANGQKIGIKQRTAKEWQNSKNAQFLRRNDSQKYFDKVNSFNNADELLKASREYVGEEIKHIRQDSFVEFARGIVDFKVGDRGYSADIIVGTTKDGKALLYDIVNIGYKKIESASNTGQFRRSDTLSIDSINQKDSSVNTYSMQQSKNNSEKFSNRDVARYTERQYNDFGWASYNDVITSKEREILLSRYADFKHNKDKYPVTRFGETVVHSGDCPDVIMYVKGSIASPQITKVVRIEYFDTAEIKEEILNNERRHLSEPYAAIEYFYGEEILSISKARDYASFQEYKSEQKRRNSEKSDTNSQKQQDRSRGIVENQDGNEKSDQIKRSDRDYSAVSNRSLLATALESAAQNDIEKSKLNEYKSKIEEMDKQSQKLSELRQEIKELSFAKGPRDKAKIRKLQDEAIKTANRIDLYDRQLLKLEAAKPLQNVLEREKKKAVQRQKAKDTEILKEYKET